MGWDVEQGWDVDTGDEEEASTSWSLKWKATPDDWPDHDFLTEGAQVEVTPSTGVAVDFNRHNESNASVLRYVNGTGGQIKPSGGNWWSGNSAPNLWPLVADMDPAWDPRTHEAILRVLATLDTPLDASGDNFGAGFWNGSSDISDIRWVRNTDGTKVYDNFVMGRSADNDGGVLKATPPNRPLIEVVMGVGGLGRGKASNNGLAALPWQAGGFTGDAGNPAQKLGQYPGEASGWALTAANARAVLFAYRISSPTNFTVTFSDVELWTRAWPSQ